MSFRKGKPRRQVKISFFSRYVKKEHHDGLDVVKKKRKKFETPVIYELYIFVTISRLRGLTKSRNKLVL